MRELGTVKCEQMVQKIPGIPVKADEPFHLNSPQNYRKFLSNGKRSYTAVSTKVVQKSVNAYATMPTGGLGYTGNTQ